MKTSRCEPSPQCPIFFLRFCDRPRKPKMVIIITSEFPNAKLPTTKNSTSFIKISTDTSLPEKDYSISKWSMLFLALEYWLSRVAKKWYFFNISLPSNLPFFWTIGLTSPITVLTGSLFTQKSLRIESPCFLQKKQRFQKRAEMPRSAPQIVFLSISNFIVL